ncbi:hypothetical protein [Amycolatopsis anabasis]|uniref:hypothetical protein n=1 Tax=Amycolatopsis anabasis TaxID=1840409 RepID=UPI00131EA656|nr:hypothetical protein [Amycolatopsis anabasis]
MTTSPPTRRRTSTRLAQAEPGDLIVGKDAHGVERCGRVRRLRHPGKHAERYELDSYAVPPPPPGDSARYVVHLVDYLPQCATCGGQLRTVPDSDVAVHADGSENCPNDTVDQDGRPGRARLVPRCFVCRSREFHTIDGVAVCENCGDRFDAPSGA